MKVIIKGKMYDTDKSELIYTDKFRMRRYYMTPHRNFFVVYGNGKAATKTEDDIKLLLGEHDVEKYLELFPAPEEA
jgi:hypothetical protein